MVKSNSDWTTFGVLLFVLVVGAVLLYFCMPGKTNKQPNEEFMNVHSDLIKSQPPSTHQQHKPHQPRAHHVTPTPEEEESHVSRPSPPQQVLTHSNKDNVVDPSADINDPSDSNETPMELHSSGTSDDATLPKDCFPKDQLTPQELLPADANSTWAQVTPAGQGALGDQNFLNAGFHVGINTVGQTLRNANMQLRSEPPNPQVKVSPWLQSTIEPDTNRKPLEIGGC